jgi:hypothetical protein
LVVYFCDYHYFSYLVFYPLTVVGVSVHTAVETGNNFEVLRAAMGRIHYPVLCR